MIYGLLVTTMACVHGMEKSSDNITWHFGERDRYEQEKLLDNIKEASLDNIAIITALKEWDYKKLNSLVFHSKFNPNMQIKTSVGNVDLFIYLMLYQDQNENKHVETFTQSCIALINAGVPIKKPSDKNTLSAFGLAKTEYIFSFIVDISNNQEHYLDTYFSTTQCTLFQNMCCSTMPLEELEKIYGKYAPSIDYPMVGGGNIIHGLLAYYLSFNLMQYLHFCTSETQKKTPVSFDDFYTKNTEETLKKILFFITKGADFLFINTYDQTPYTFYFALLKSLYQDNRAAYPLNQTEMQPLVDHLFDVKDTIERIKQPLMPFFKGGLLLAKKLVELYPYITDQNPMLIRTKEISIPADIAIHHFTLADALLMHRKD